MKLSKVLFAGIAVAVVGGALTYTSLAKAEDETNDSQLLLNNYQPVDTEAPTITGPGYLKVTQNETIDFVRLYTVKDNNDSSVSLTTPKVSTEKVGRFSAMLKATDAADNQATKLIVIEVIAPEKTAAEKEKEASKAATETGNLTAEAEAPVEQPAPVAVEEPVVAQAEPETAPVETAPAQSAPAASEASATPAAPSAPAAEQPAQPAQPAQPSYAPNTMYVGGSAIPYQNGGQGAGQSVIDANPYGAISTWGGAASQSGTDGLNSHFIGHNPGIFSVLFSLGGGSQIIVTDGAGNPTTYTVRNIMRVNDSAVDINNGTNYWDQITGTGGGERITLQTCIDDHTNLIVMAYA